MPIHRGQGPQPCLSIVQAKVLLLLPEGLLMANTTLLQGGFIAFAVVPDTAPFRPLCLWAGRLRCRAYTLKCMVLLRGASHPASFHHAAVIKPGPVFSTSLSVSISPVCYSVLRHLPASAPALHFALRRNAGWMGNDFTSGQRDVVKSPVLT